MVHLLSCFHVVGGQCVCGLEMLGSNDLCGNIKLELALVYIKWKPLGLYLQELLKEVQLSRTLVFRRDSPGVT